MRIGPVEIGERTFVVAEIGGNHGGDPELAARMIVEAAEAGADAVKFQTYRAELLVHKGEEPLPHVRARYRTQQERFRSLELKEEDYRRLASLARSHGVVFFSTPFDEGSADFLDEMVPAFKIASGDLTNLALIRHVAKKGKPVIMSTGMATVDEIRLAAREVPEARLVLLHCVSAYPAPMEEANLRAIPFLKTAFPGVLIGYSDHTIGTLACLGAVALGAVVIEKHFTTDKGEPIGDHKLSADFEDLKGLVRDIRALEAALGTPSKEVGASESRLRPAMRRGLAAARDLPTGTRIEPQMLVPLRPLRGIPAEQIDQVVGKALRRDVAEGEFLTREDVEW